MFQKTPLFILAISLLLAACQASPVSPPPGEAPATSPPACGSEDFLIAQVGQDYYRAHFELVHKEVIDDQREKASFTYTNQPYVQEYPMSLILDRQECRLVGGEVSTILLEPQTFELSEESAIETALANGLAPNENYQTDITLDRTTENRFAWEVISPGVEPTQENREPVVRVLLDVESGKVYAIEKIAPMRQHQNE